MPEREPFTQMTARERELRGQLAELIAEAGFVRGTLSVREKSCGKPTCRCARGEKHIAFYLVASEGGKIRQLYIPRSLEAKARRWIEGYHQIRAVLEELSQLHWDRLKRREP
jgi:hypothetical protein